MNDIQKLRNLINLIDNQDMVPRMFALLDEIEANYKAVPKPGPHDSLYIQQAQAQYEEEGAVEIDENAVVSLGDDEGAYVQAWVWVYDSDAGLAHYRHGDIEDQREDWTERSERIREELV